MTGFTFLKSRKWEDLPEILNTPNALLTKFCARQSVHLQDRRSLNIHRNWMIVHEASEGNGTLGWVIQGFMSLAFMKNSIFFLRKLCYNENTFRNPINGESSKWIQSHSPPS